MTRWGDRPARLIARATRLYATLLEESTHPALLGDALAREGVFAVLWSESAQDPARERLIEHETAALWRGDVPFFTHRPTGTAVTADGGARVPDLLPVAALTAVREKIGRMDEVDCLDQEWVISATLAVRGASSRRTAPGRSWHRPPCRRWRRTRPGCWPPPAGSPTRSRPRAVRGGTRTNWIGLERVSGDHWAVLPMGAGLAQGYCGVALFLAHTEALTGSGRYGAAAREAVRPPPPCSRRSPRTPS